MIRMVFIWIVEFFSGWAFMVGAAAGLCWLIDDMNRHWFADDRRRDY